VEESYDGMRLGKEMTRQFIDDMVQRFKDNKRIHKKYVLSFENFGLLISGLSNISRD